MNFLVVLTGACATYFCYKFWKGISQKVKKPSHAGFRFLKLEDCDAEKTCVICMNNCRNLVFEECMHMVLCNECYPSLERQECPLCKQPIRAVKNVYTLVD